MEYFQTHKPCDDFSNRPAQAFNFNLFPIFTNSYVINIPLPGPTKGLVCMGGHLGRFSAKPFRCLPLEAQYCQLQRVFGWAYNLLQLSYLSEEQLNRFQTPDLRAVAGYLRQKRIDPDNYVPSKEALKHYYDVARVMAALTGDKGFVLHYNERVRAANESEVSMCEMIDKITAFISEITGLPIDTIQALQI